MVVVPKSVVFTFLGFEVGVLIKRSLALSQKVVFLMIPVKRNWGIFSACKKSIFVKYYQDLQSCPANLLLYIHWNRPSIVDFSSGLNCVNEGYRSIPTIDFAVT